MTPDCDLLRQYVEQHDETAFAEVVRRNVDLVYSVALRQLAGDTHLAQDVTQAVFLDLVRKVRPLSRRTTLAGWLHTSARLAAWKAVRGEQRRRTREQESLAMNETPTTAEMNWEQLKPLLDECVGHLGEMDRDAIVLRYFEGKSHREVGTALGLSENSANKRIERALEKLRGYFARRGVTVPAAVLAVAMSQNSVRAAPAGLVANVAGASLAGVKVGTLRSGWPILFSFMNNQAKIAIAVVIVGALLISLRLRFQSPEAEISKKLEMPKLVAGAGNGRGKSPNQVEAPSVAAAPASSGTSSQPQLLEVSTVQVMIASGEIQLRAPDGSTRALGRGDKFQEGSTIITGINGTLLMTFSNGANVKLAANTELVLDKFQQIPFEAEKTGTFLRLSSDPGESHVVLNLRKGTISCEVKPLNEESGSTFMVNTPDGPVEPSGVITVKPKAPAVSLAN